MSSASARPADPFTQTQILDTLILLFNYDWLSPLTGNFSMQHLFSSTNIISFQTLMADSICHYHCGTRPPPLPKQPPIFSILPLSPSPGLRENEKKKSVPWKVSCNQYSDEGCCFGAQYNTRVMSSIYRYCNSHELYFIGCTLSYIRLSCLLIYVFCSWQDLIHAPTCIHIGMKKEIGFYKLPIHDPRVSTNTVREKNMRWKL